MDFVRHFSARTSAFALVIAGLAAVVLHTAPVQANPEHAREIRTEKEAKEAVELSNKGHTDRFTQIRETIQRSQRQTLSGRPNAHNGMKVHLDTLWRQRELIQTEVLAFRSALLQDRSNPAPARRLVVAKANLIEQRSFIENENLRTQRAADELLENLEEMMRFRAAEHDFYVESGAQHVPGNVEGVNPETRSTSALRKLNQKNLENLSAREAAFRQTIEAQNERAGSLPNLFIKLRKADPRGTTVIELSQRMRLLDGSIEQARTKLDTALKSANRSGSTADLDREEELGTALDDLLNERRDTKTQRDSMFRGLSAKAKTISNRILKTMADMDRQRSEELSQYRGLKQRISDIVGVNKIYVEALLIGIDNALADGARQNPLPQAAQEHDLAQQPPQREARPQQGAMQKLPPAPAAQRAAAALPVSPAHGKLPGRPGIQPAAAGSAQTAAQTGGRQGGLRRTKAREYAKVPTRREDPSKNTYVNAPVQQRRDTGAQVATTSRNARPLDSIRQFAETQRATGQDSKYEDASTALDAGGQTRNEQQVAAPSPSGIYEPAPTKSQAAYLAAQNPQRPRGGGPPPNNRGQ